MAEQSDCKKQIVKIAENNVELQYYLLSPVTMEKVILPEYTEAYGQTRIDDDRAVADTEWAFWDGLDAQGIADKITDAADDVAYYNKLQTAMGEDDGYTLELD